VKKLGFPTIIKRSGGPHQTTLERNDAGTNGLRKHSSIKSSDKPSGVYGKIERKEKGSLER